MKIILSVLTVLFLVSCSSTRIVDTWTNQEHLNYKPKKVLIVGVTENLTARRLFESKLKDEFTARGINAVESYNVFKPTFTNAKQTEEEIDEEVKRVSNNGFDSVLISAVKGVDEKVTYSGDAYRTNYYWRRFGRYYYLYQDVYFDRGYYEKYNVYHIEASLYNLKENNDKSLVWVASYDIVDPNTINTTINDYVNAIIKSLEKENIISNK
ncbi:hypothetical protein GCM10011531_01350 [Aquaticitalea lipolytica]|jgi:hypothetical protein|uniref:Cardiolipin synthetase n=1 Tax=Aquaticitalea lipolytica TaxID=1247562 RepID=A0A8J2TJ78_9FLAO|nr:hypothetical protein [Aquaticitalea lipolytica]GFZ76213.1 hypothetical protein GCM10011531_01350 [Aquaticitalea lipolytica]